MRHFPALCALLFGAVFTACPAQADTPRVLVSIAPLAGIAAAVMDGVGTPDVLITGNASPHTYQLRPSDAKRLEQADLVIWVGPGLETFLEKPLTQLASHATQLELAQAPGLTHYTNRSGGVWEPEAEDEHETEHDAPDHGHEHDDEHQHNHGANDPHLWLDPRNAAAIAQLIAQQLAAQDPAHAARYASNAAAFNADVLALHARLQAQLTPLKNRGFIVFHDAYQYFEKSYGLAGRGSITLSPEVPPSAAQLAALQQRIQSHEVVCVLAEPQFRAALVDTLVGGTSARKGLVNPDASDLPLSAHLYQEYLQRLADQFAACLTAQ